MRLIAIKCVTFFALAVSGSVMPYFVRYVLHAGNDWIGDYIILGSVTAVVSIPLWLWLSRRVDKRRLAIVAYGIYGLSCLSWFLASAAEPKPWTILRIVVNGVSAVGSILFLRSMFTDTIAYDYLRTGLRREGAFTGLFSLVEKAFSALGLASVGAALGAAGYIASLNNGIAQQPAAAVLVVRILFAVLPAIAGGVAALVLVGYRLDAATLERMKQERASSS